MTLCNHELAGGSSLAGLLVCGLGALSSQGAASVLQREWEILINAMIKWRIRGKHLLNENVGKRKRETFNS